MNTAAHREHYRLSIPIHRIKNDIRIRHLTEDEVQNVLASRSGVTAAPEAEVVGVRAVESEQGSTPVHGSRMSLQDIASCNR